MREGTPAGGPASSSKLILARMHAFLVRFRHDERGVSAVFFGILFTGILIAGAMAVDYTRAVSEMTRQQAALDAAVLAASTHLGLPDQDTAGVDLAKKFFAENLRRGSDAKIDAIAFDAENGSITAKSSSVMMTTLMRAFGHDTMNVGANSQVMRGDSTVELVMVLDNSGSMAGSYIADLKTAAKNLTQVVFAGTEGTDKVRIGVVPFAASVKVGSGYRDAPWIDGEAQSSIHSENFDTAKSRFQLFDALGVAWAGCVEQRPGTLDTNDTPATPGNPDTLFVPMFAPDEPDPANAAAAGYSNYSNSYISDYGGTCPPPEQICVNFNKKKNTCTETAPAPMPVAQAQARTCKYAGAAISGGNGPNASCTTKPLLPLTDQKQAVEDSIDGLVATGNTNIGEGTMWGWRLLSPEVPFTEGRSYTDEKNRKVLVVMTDGENTYTASSDHNKSRYASAGYASKGRLGGTYTSNAYRARMDAKLRTACTRAKTAGVTIFTVAFRLETNPDTQALLKECATTKDGFFAASNGAALIQAFQNIGREISQLRVAG